MRLGRVLSTSITFFLLLLPLVGRAEDKPIPRSYRYALRRAPRLALEFDLGGTRGSSVAHTPKPLSFRPSMLLGWTVAKDLRLGAELRHTGGTGLLVGFGFVWSLP